MRFDDGKIFNIDNLFDTDINDTVYCESEMIKKLDPQNKDLVNQCQNLKEELLNKKARDYSYTEHIPRPVYTGPFKKNDKGEIIEKTEMCTKMDEMKGKCIPFIYFQPEQYKPPNEETDLEYLKPGNLIKYGQNNAESQKQFLNSMAAYKGTKMLGSINSVESLLNLLTRQASNKIQEQIPNSYGLKWYKDKYKNKHFPNDTDTIINNMESSWIQPVGELISGGGYCSLEMRKNGTCKPLGTNYVIGVERNKGNKYNNYIYLENIPSKDLQPFRGLLPGIAQDFYFLVSTPLDQIFYNWTLHDIPIGEANIINNKNNYYVFTDYCLKLEELLKTGNIDKLNVIMKKNTNKDIKTDYSKYNKICKQISGISDFPISYCAYIYYGMLYYVLDSCHGKDCKIPNAKCLAGSPGSEKKDWICKNDKWIKHSIPINKENEKLLGIPKLNDKEALLYIQKISKNEGLMDYLSKFIFLFAKCDNLETSECVKEYISLLNIYKKQLKKDQTIRGFLSKPTIKPKIDKSKKGKITETFINSKSNNVLFLIVLFVLCLYLYYYI